MIEIRKANALRLALRMAQHAPEHLGVVALYPDGNLAATDGISLVFSRDAHESEVPLSIRPGRALPVSKTADSYALDVGESQLVERRPRSEGRIDVEVLRGIDLPKVYVAIPTHLTPVAGEAPPFDSIVAGRIATDYGLERGVWRRGPWDDRVYLEGVDDGDTVVLAGVRR